MPLQGELLADAKERAEHIMLVDLGRNDVGKLIYLEGPFTHRLLTLCYQIGRVAAPGTVRVDSLMHIERYSHVMHIVSNVSGQVRRRF
jgi:anthranilate synthase component 1